MIQSIFRHSRFSLNNLLRACFILSFIAAGLILLGGESKITEAATSPVVTDLSSVTGQSCIYPLPTATAKETYYWLDQEYAFLDGESLRYDMAAPRLEGKYPLIILVHGGAFQLGDKTTKFPEETLRAIAAQGYVVATVNYSLATSSLTSSGGQNHFPRPIQDLRCAVKYFRSGSHNSLRFIDTSKIGVLGTSAGGHLGLLLGTAEQVPEFDDPNCPFNQYSADVQSVAAFYPSTRFRPQSLLEWDTYSNLRTDHDEYIIFGTQSMNVIDLIKKGSPLWHIENYDPLKSTYVPPMLLVNAGLEKNQALATSTILLDQSLTKANLPHIFFTESNAYHGYEPITDRIITAKNTTGTRDIPLTFPESACYAMQFFDATLRDGNDNIAPVRPLSSIINQNDKLVVLGVHHAKGARYDTCESAWGKVTVNVSSDLKGTDIVLAVNAYKPTIWDIKNPAGVNIKAIVLTGYDTQHVQGDLGAAQIIHKTNFTKDDVTAGPQSAGTFFNAANSAWPSRVYYSNASCSSQSSISQSQRRYFNPSNDWAFARHTSQLSPLANKLKTWTGLDINSFQGAYETDSFTVSKGQVKGISTSSLQIVFQKLQEIEKTLRALVISFR